MKLKVQLNPGRYVINPESGQPLKMGVPCEVEESIFWRRRLQAKDVTDIDEAEEKPSAPAKAAKQSKSAKPPKTAQALDHSAGADTPAQESAAPETSPGEGTSGQ